MIVLTRALQFHGDPKPLTWGLPIFRARQNPTSIYADDLAIVCCAKGHRTRLTRKAHGIDGRGVVTPAYKCTAPGCDFREEIQLHGWPPKR